VFLWLAFKRRHWTADRRHRHGLDDIVAAYILPLCDQEPESCDHLSIFRSFTLQIWTLIGNRRPIQFPNLQGVTAGLVEES
jgi:hypothetical protein